MMLILVVALVFFGPRKLPELSRKIGKGLAEFRKASEDFKHTWEREVAIETSSHTEATPDHTIRPPDNSIIEATVERTEAVHNAVPQEGVATQIEAAQEPASIPNDSASTSAASGPTPSEPTLKRDWL
jgi:sec-independent protein translocase protein TatB